jgi:hypothetical protein
MKVYEKIVNVVAGVGFLALVPVGLGVFNVYAPLDFLSKQLGFWGSATFLVLVFYGLTTIRILFGHAELYAPLVIGVLSSFLLLSAAVRLSFMAWYWSLVRQAAFLGNTQLIFLIALVVLGLAVLLSSLKKFPVIAELLILVVLPVATIVVLHYFGIGDFQKLLGLPPARVESP